MSEIDYSNDLNCSAIFHPSAILKFTSDYLNLLENTQNLENSEMGPRNISPNISNLKNSVSIDSHNLSENIKRSMTETHFSPDPKDLTHSCKFQISKNSSVFTSQNEDKLVSKKKEKENHNLNPKKRRSNKIIPDSPKPVQEPVKHTKSTPLVFGNPFLSLIQSRSASQSNFLKVQPISLTVQSVNISSESRKTPAFGLSILSNSSERRTPRFGVSSINQNSREMNSVISNQNESSLKFPENKKKKDILETNPESQESEEMIRSSIRTWLKDRKELFEQPSCWCFIRRDSPLGMIEGLKNEKKFEDIKKIVTEAIWKKFGIEMGRENYSLLDLCLVYEVLRESEGEVVDVYEKVEKSSRKRLAEVKKKKVECFEKGIDWMFDMVERDVIERTS